MQKYEKIVNLILCICILCILCIGKRRINIEASLLDNDYVLTQQVHNQYLDNALLESNTYNSNITLYHSYLVSYYDNLTYNFGVNYKGSCGYVGIGMLLSYYDTFLTDELITENYDVNSIGDHSNMIDRRNSPGILRDIVADPNNSDNVNYGRNMTSVEYYNHMLSISNQSLHAKLIAIGGGKGYYNFDDDYLSAVLSFNEIIDILETYLVDIFGLNTLDFNISYSIENVKDYAIQNVLNNTPVLLGVRGENGGHIVVAYDYDAESDNLYCHFGWGADKTHRTIESEFFSNYEIALTIDFASTHSHTNNYGVTTINNNIPLTSYYCFDSSEITLINHSYTHRYEKHTSFNHKAYCECGEYITQTHTMKTTGGLINRYSTCIHCGYTVDLKDTPVVGPYNAKIIKKTENGNYILNKKMIYLVDEDNETYLSRTLINQKKMKRHNIVTH